MTSRILSKEKIIAMAVDLVNQQEELSFTKLSKKLGTRSQAIYNYYSDVRALKIAIAVNFYDKLAIRLRADLLGISGKQAVKAFANITVQYALGKLPIFQLILGITAEKEQDESLSNSIGEIYQIMNSLLDSLITNKKQRLVVSRMLRSLIIGEIVQVGSGEFNNKLISARDSFDQMLDITLAAV